MYFRYHVNYDSPKTGQPVGLFVAVWHLVGKCLTEEETQEYWKNRKYFEEALPIPPFYSDGNTIGAVTWFKNNDKTSKLVNKLEFYFRMLKKYNVSVEVTETDSPGKIIYEDDYQVGVVASDIEK
ncbi:hypothetical protein Ana3638_15420 [Anaerocolumna sedimenticola]|uniref:Uncharacterized protein n=1 Tax=Anaerocolumna sedimenticola TaxID=2696063 RepID=A0A6P1TP90_9FIRM|nr:hypothetical protein [Anaerocolumna sedimenticola]QHQ62002.1 hypothetical protein Ana3638_15420 [Anaerocolumna sedimenticola]